MKGHGKGERAMTRVNDKDRGKGRDKLKEKRY